MLGFVTKMFSFTAYKKLTVLGTFIGVLIFYGGAAAAPQGDWRTLETKYMVVYYQNPDDLRLLGSRVKYDTGGWTLFNRSISWGSSDNISKKVDSLFDRVQILLDMKKRTPKIVLYLFPDDVQFRIAYENALNERPSGGVNARYIPQDKAVYAVPSEIDEASLAREMAHAVANHYLIIKPSRKATDILAKYVGKHLMDPNAPQTY